MYSTDGYLFLVSSIIYLIIFGLFLSNSRLLKENKAFLFLCLISLVYCFGSYGFLKIKLEDDFWYWQKIIRVSSLLLPATILMFMIKTTKKKSKINGWLVILGYLISLALILAEREGVYIKGFIKEKDLIIPEAGKYFSYIIGYYVIYGSYTIYLLIDYFKDLKHLNEKRYTRTLILAFLLFVLACGLNVLSLYTKRIGFLSEVTIFATTLFVLFSIVKHNLLQVNLIIRKSFIYAFLTITITFIFLISVLLLERVFEYVFGFHSFLPTIMFVLIMALIFQPLKNKLQLFIDQVFFKEGEDKQKLIRNLSKNVATILDQKALLTSIINIITAIISTEKVSIFLLDQKKKKYFIYTQEGLQKEEISFSFINSLLVFLEEEKKEVLVSQLKEEEMKKSNVYVNLKEDMDKIKAEICIPITYRTNLWGFFSLGRKLSETTYSNEDVDTLWMLANETAISLENIRFHNNAKEQFLSAIKSLVSLNETRNPYLKEHGKNVAYYSAEVAKELGLSLEVIKSIEDGGNLHDIGMFGINDEVLKKEDKLTEEEFALIKNHPKIGKDFLVSHLFPKEIYDAISGHHETLSGDGYPNGLAGNAVLMAARIVAVTTAYNAMRSDRPYRKALSKKEAVHELLMSSGKRFDKKIVDILVKVLDKEDQRKIA
ncbi:HD domain-containing protein [bacterium]|nr:HD domain-containing protein [bacterium]